MGVLLSAVLLVGAAVGSVAAASGPAGQRIDARVFRHTGEITGRPNSAVEMRVQRLSDGSYRLDRLRFRRVPGTCGGDPSNEVSLRVGRPVSTKPSGRFRQSFENKDGAVLAVSGRVSWPSGQVR